MVPQLSDVASQLGARQAQILAQWRDSVAADPQITGIAHMTRSQFYDHIPQVLDAFCARLGAAPDADPNQNQEIEMAQQHSQHRWQQGYKLRSLVREWGRLNCCVVRHLDALQVEADALAQARQLWAEFVNRNIGEGVAEYESLLQTEASARLGDLERALETMKMLETERGELLREVSHDLRGSLSVVAGASSLLEHQSMPDGDRNRVASILQSGVRSVTEMIGDLMTMARLEAGHEEPQNAPFDAAHLLVGLCADSRLLAEEKGLFLRTEGSESLEATGDAAKTRRIAQNLLHNALKYTVTGGVVMSWHEVETGQWSFSVSDTGPGLKRSGAVNLAGKIAKATDDAHEIGAHTPDDAPTPNAFTPDDSTLAPLPATAGESAPTLFSQSGEGIGLSIVRRLCEITDATLELEAGGPSGEEQGSTFRVVLPRYAREK